MTAYYWTDLDMLLVFAMRRDLRRDRWRHIHVVLDGRGAAVAEVVAVTGCGLR